ncbi:MAG: hypothetical protein QME76_12560 [Bacillota bacterium]|nr:hypothetical protein [Bacillota bacterium]
MGQKPKCSLQTFAASSKLIWNGELALSVSAWLHSLGELSVFALAILRFPPLSAAPSVMAVSFVSSIQMSDTGESHLKVSDELRFLTADIVLL